MPFRPHMQSILAAYKRERDYRERLALRRAVERRQEREARLDLDYEPGNWPLTTKGRK